MYLSLVWAALCNLLYFALHVTYSGSFPKPLTPRQERECLEKIRQGDLAAKNMLIEHNLRLVAHIVKKYYAISGEQEDLISIGTIGLIKAASTFDYEKSKKFSTYASKCIENEVLMHFRSRRKSASDVSLSEPVDTDREGNSLTLMDIMSEEVDMVGGEAALPALMEEFGITVVVETLGAAGARCFFQGQTWDTAARKVPCVDTNGAGDAFWGAFLSSLRIQAVEGAQSITEDILRRAMEYGSAAGGLTVQKKGAIPALPTRKEIEAFLND